MKTKYEIELEFGSEFQRQVWDTLFEKLLKTFCTNFTQKHKKNHTHVKMDRR